MSADDWVSCPKCKKYFKEFLSKCYGEIPEDQFSLLKRVEILYDKGTGDFDIEFTEDEMARLRDIEIQQKTNFIPDNEHDQRIIETVSHDGHSFLTEDGLLHVMESFECEFCRSEWDVNHKYEEGRNNLKKSGK